MTDKVKKVKRARLTGIVLIALVILVSSLTVLTIIGTNSPIASGPGGRPAAGEADMVYSVLARELDLTSLENYLRFNGDVIAENSVSIYPDTGGKLTKLHVSLGSYVRKDQVLAEVDPSLPGQVFIPSPVKSTISGTITDLPFKVGATISSPQVPIATVGDLTDLQLVSYISEKDAASIRLGQTAEIYFEAFPGELFSGRVSEISPVLDRASRTLEIEISLDERDARIKSGMFGGVKLITEVKQAVVAVPNESLITSDQGTFVYIVEEGDRAAQRFVETGLVIDGTTEILSGLSPGDVIVTRGQSMLRHGSSLRITG